MGYFPLIIVDISTRGIRMSINDQESTGRAKKSLNETIGERIARRRGDEGLKRNVLARRAAIPYSTLIGYERGTNEPSVSRLAKIAEVLNVSLDWLAGREGFPETAPGLRRVEISLASAGPRMKGSASESYRAVPILSYEELLEEGGEAEDIGAAEFAILSSSQLLGRTDVVGFLLKKGQRRPIPACIPPPAILFIDRQDKKASAKGIFAVRTEEQRLAFGRLHWAPPRLTVYSALSEEQFTSIDVRQGARLDRHLIGRVIMSFQTHI
jgi:transcriptional regulator with XRE-family HTH domain